MVDSDGPTVLGFAIEAVEKFAASMLMVRPRSVQLPSQGKVVKVPRVAGLHHEYLRRAA